MADILIIEDEELINNLLKENLTLTGHHCTQIYEGEAAMEAVKEGKWDLILLDLMLPGCSGYDVLQQRGESPVIILTAKDGVYDKVKGLNLGAEDYLVKPFDMLELLARVNVVLRRKGAGAEVFSLPPLQVNLQSHVVTLAGEEIYLTLKEYELLEYFIRNKNIALSRERLIEQVWGYDYGGDTRTVDVHVAALRKKLKLENHLKTVYKLGYRLEDLE
ncbi:MAG: response regulator transcription factor [Lachnospiraceae bacterium]|nr:response regulator transcription factor [Lachnospiraceae bacterium]